MDKDGFQRLWQLAQKATQAESDRELGFLWVNESLALTPYRQSALWLEQEGLWCLSGVVQIDANVPYAQWLSSVFEHLQQDRQTGHRVFKASDLPVDLALQWKEWWPQHAVWLSLDGPRGLRGAGIMARDEPWSPAEVEQLSAWTQLWCRTFEGFYAPRRKRLSAWREAWATWWSWKPQRPWWRQHRLGILFSILALLLWPVKLTVLAPGELVPAHPVVVRAPLEGIIDRFYVQPNQSVEVKQALFGFDEVVLQSKIDVAQQSLNVALVDYRQTNQLALTDAKAKTQLGLLIGKIEEREAEIAYLQDQLERARVLAPQAGVVLMDDPTEWLGRPVKTGERILRIATLSDVEVEAWLPMADSVPLKSGDEVVLYLNSSPLSPVQAKLRYLAFEAVLRPDGQFAYRVRAQITGSTQHRVGLKGTVKLQGRWVPVSYWVMRRPIATARAYLGW